MHGRQLTPEERQWVRGADELQEIGSWTLQRLDRPPARLNRYTLKDDPARAADEERRRLRVAVSEQLDWPNPTTALRTWRSRIEDEGVLTFQFAIGAERVPGFSLWDDYTPVITINRGYNLASRIFTLFHEYAHLLQRRDAVLDTAPTPSQRQSIDNLERWCEQFAACLLLPADALLGVTSDAFDFRSTETVIAFDQVKKLADQFHVSYQAMARRLEEIELAPARLVAQVDRMVSQRRREPGFSAVRRLELRTQTYGERLPRILIEGVESDVLNRLDVLDALDIQAGEFGLLQAQLGDTSV